MIASTFAHTAPLNWCKKNIYAVIQQFAMEAMAHLFWWFTILLKKCDCPYVKSQDIPGNMVLDI